jgi:beta-glucosidase
MVDPADGGSKAAERFEEISADEARIEELLGALTLEEKVRLLGGKDSWHVPGIERPGIPALKVTDGPNGARGDGPAGTGVSCVCVPCGSALGAT